MHAWSFNLLLGPAFLAASIGHAEAPTIPAQDSPARTIIMFGASWCAPCVAELRNINALASAAAPDEILVVWSDGRIQRLGVQLPANVTVAKQSNALRLSRQYASEITGLPYSVMTDREGRSCVGWRKGLTPAAIAEMRRSCLTRN